MENNKSPAVAHFRFLFIFFIRDEKFYYAFHNQPFLVMFSIKSVKL